MPPTIYEGFLEHAYRLVFPFEDKFPACKPKLQVVLPSGVIENERVLEPVAGKGIIAYAYPQSMAADKAQAFIDTPFVWERADGTFALIQTWTTTFNDKFKSEFQIATANPDVTKFSEQAVEEFKSVCVSLFGEDARDVLYCHRESHNDRKVYVGDRATLLAFLRAEPQVVAELDIKSLTDDGFVAGTTDGKGETGTKPFAMAPEGEYALYTKIGWHTMACVTPMEQFVDGRDLIGPV